MSEYLRESVRTLLQGKMEERDQMRQRLQDPEVVTDGRLSGDLNRQLQPMERVVAPFEEFLELEKQLQESLELSQGDDAELAELALEEVPELQESLTAQADRVLENLVISDDEISTKSIVLEVRAGTGGDEACLFARDLFRMYSRYAETHHFRFEVLSQSPTEMGGFREVVISLKGANAWQLLQFESGGHRVQRVPETEGQGRIHTSAATVAVLPEPEEVDIQISNKDLRLETMRASGPGGQHVNKTSSAVRITHLPTNIVVFCQDEKSQHKNRTKAMRVLRTRLFERERQEQQSERARERRSQIGSGDRNERVRTYNFPQNRVTDHRLKENFSLEQVIDGKLDTILDHLILREKEERIKAL